MANNLRLDPFPDPVGHFGAPWRPYVIGHFELFSINKFLDPSTPSMRNKKTTSKSKMAAKGPQNGRYGLEKGKLWVISHNKIKQAGAKLCQAYRVSRNT